MGWSITTATGFIRLMTFTDEEKMRTRAGIAAMLIAITSITPAFGGALPERETAYAQLLEQFSVVRPGFGDDSHFDEPTDQAMTYGLVLWAEANRYRAVRTPDGLARIRAAAQWLDDNRDLDNDGHPGWGLPKAYDTWSDGSINPIHTPYTITTAICLLGLIEAVDLRDVWPDDARERYHRLIADTLLHWTRDAWTEGFGGGYYWYSPNPNDRIYCVNPSSMMLAALVNALARERHGLTDDETAFLQKRADLTLQALLATAQPRDGAPYWRYAPLPNHLNHDHANDAIHQAYTLWGVETYRDHCDRVKIPWPREKSVESLDRYLRDGKPRLHPQDKQEPRGDHDRLDRLWGRGMVLAFYAKWSDRARSERTLRELMTHYGDWPRLKEWPTDPADAPFFPRQAAHVLLGLSLMAYE